MPSPVPTLCSRKSLYGWKILLPNEAGTVNAPAATEAPAGAVVNEETWQMSQPTLWNRVAPATPSDEAASAVSRGGTLVARMNRAKWSTSFKPSESGVLSLGSGTTSHNRVTSTLLGGKRLLMPISFRYASLENESSEACWSFHPKRSEERRVGKECRTRRAPED